MLSVCFSKDLYEYLIPADGPGFQWESTENEEIKIRSAVDFDFDALAARFIHIHIHTRTMRFTFIRTLY